MIVYTAKRDTTDVKKALEYLTNWHPWFAWYPVWIGPTLRWLEWVEQKYTMHYDDCEVAYRPLDLENCP